MSLLNSIKKANEVSTTPQNAKGAMGPHLQIKALAGTGKTTVLIEGLKYLFGRHDEIEITPSPQQQAIWDDLVLGNTPESVRFCSFNASIAKTLQKRIPNIDGVEALTWHTLGKGILHKNFKLKNGDDAVNSFRTADILCELEGRSIWDIRKDDIVYLNRVNQFVKYCKVNVMEGSPEDLQHLSAHYGLSLNCDQFDMPKGSAPMRERLETIIPKVLERSLDIQRDGCMDFDDMVWLPVVLKGLEYTKVDLILWDESQDGNRIQQSLAKKLGRRIVMVGDVNQAIYGFAGADSESMERMEKELTESKQGCNVLPLYETRRCGKKIVGHINRLVPEFTAHDDNPDGVVEECHIHSNWREQIQPGDMIVSRTNAVLIKECFKLLKRGVKANIQGWNIGQNLIRHMEVVLKKEIGRTKVSERDPIYASVDRHEMVKRLDEWTHQEILTEQSKRHPSLPYIDLLTDKLNCIKFFGMGCRDCLCIVKKIRNVFTDEETEGVLLSSIHKAKGLEAESVWHINVKESPCPHPMAKQRWEKTQELNLLYVAESRAIRKLTTVTGSYADDNPDNN